MINVENLVHEIELKTGIPAALLTAADAEGVLHQARELLEFRRENHAAPDGSGQQSTRDQFAQWMSAAYGSGDESNADPAQAAIDEIEKMIELQNGGYPVVQDGGEVPGIDPRSPKEKFSEWFHRSVGGIDFRKDDDGFINMVL